MKQNAASNVDASRQERKPSQAKPSQEALSKKLSKLQPEKKERTRDKKQLDDCSDGHDEEGKEQETRLYKTPATTEEKETCASVRNTQAMQTTKQTTKTPKGEREREREREEDSKRDETTRAGEEYFFTSDPSHLPISYYLPTKQIHGKENY
jgi:hypothetical protein